MMSKDPNDDPRIHRSRPAELNRRELLRAATITTLGGAFGLGCPLRREPQTTAALAPVAEAASGGRAAWAHAEGQGFAPVNVSPDREIRTIVGLRPFRATGFRVEAEKLDDRLLVHNYGHGGGGISLSWGTSHMAMEEALAAVDQTGLSSGWGNGPAVGNGAGAQVVGKACAVIGCGVVGLSTAILMQRQGWQVTIYARDLPPNTTSNVAAGLWEPYSVSDPGRTTAAYDAQFIRAAHLANRYFQELVGDYYSVRWIDNYSLSNAPIAAPWFPAGTASLYRQARALTPAEYPFPRSHAITFKTMLIEPHGYLNALLRDFRIASGRIVVRELADLQEIATLPEPLIFNCTGLGAKALMDDPEMDSIKGQLTFLVPQPEVDYTYIGDGLYMFPRSDGILLGGTFERGNWSMDPDPDAKRRILQGHRELYRSDAPGTNAVAKQARRVEEPRVGF